MPPVPDPPSEPMLRARSFLKDDIRDQIDFHTHDQWRGVPMPPLVNPAPLDAPRVALTPPAEFDSLGLGRMSLLDGIRRRESRRQFTEVSLSGAELSFLLWATQGVRRTTARSVLRTVPSAGNRHALETYVNVVRVDEVSPGLYRYLPVEHELVLVRRDPDLARRISVGCRGQAFAGDCAVTFLWTTVPYRMEWRYGLASHKVIALDAGHVCQNLYLACEAIGAGTCAIAAYDQRELDALLGVDGREEFVIYVGPVGKVS